MTSFHSQPPHADAPTASNSQQSFSAESEQSLICAALTESRTEVMREIASQLLPTDFYAETHVNIWRCRASLADAGVAHDVLAVIATAKKLGLSIGGPEYVLGLLHDETLKTSSDIALRASAKRVKELSGLRTLTESLETALAKARSGQHGHKEISTYLSDTIENLQGPDSARATGPMHVMHYVSGVLEQVEMRLNGEVPDIGCTTGFPSLDNVTDGLGDGMLVVLAARPSMGKTAISLAIAEAIASISLENIRHVLFFSTEQGGEALSYRMIASKARVDALHIRRANFQDGEFEKVLEGAQQVGGLNLHIDETSEITMPEIRARARIFARKYGKVAVFVDYLQRVADHRVADKRVIVGEISTGFKDLAKELKCPVIALAQLSRGVEARTNKRPMMSDLGESGKIEQDADIIMFLYRDDYYNPNTKEPGITEVIVAKNRDGPIGVTKLAFNRNTQHFDDATYVH